MRLGPRRGRPAVFDWLGGSGHPASPVRPIYSVNGRVPGFLEDSAGRLSKLVRRGGSAEDSVGIDQGGRPVAPMKGVSAIRAGRSVSAPAGPDRTGRGGCMRWGTGLWPSRWWTLRGFRRPRAGHRPALDNLEGRQLLDAAPVAADIAVLHAMTPDSHQVVVDYQIQGAPVDRAFDIAIVRSADDKLSPDDQVVATYHVAGPSALGSHQATISVPGGLTINPKHPYVLAVADPTGQVPESNRANDVAAFRKASVVIVTHGGLQSTPGDRVPAWVNRLDGDLAAQGFDVVFPFNWVGVSKDAGAASKQGPRLAAQIEKLVSQFPANEPVDLHFIGHSEGAVVNSLALQKLEENPPPRVASGYIQETMLDPHAANNGFPRRQYSVKNSFMGDMAKRLINQFQSKAKDPFVSVPAIVDSADVYYQHTYFAQAEGTSRDSQWFNLWGQVPVKGPGTATYTDLTGPGISHSGDFSPVDWYQIHIVPTLGDGQTFPGGSLIKGQLDPADGTTALEPPNLRRRQPTPDQVLPLAMVSHSARPRFVGTAFPGADVWLTAVGAGRRINLGQTVVGADGTWEITAPHLADGQYKVTLRGNVPASPALPHVASTPRSTLGTLTVETRNGRR